MSLCCGLKRLAHHYHHDDIHCNPPQPRTSTTSTTTSTSTSTSNTTTTPPAPAPAPPRPPRRRRCRHHHHHLRTNDVRLRRSPGCAVCSARRQSTGEVTDGAGAACELELDSGSKSPLAKICSNSTGTPRTIDLQLSPHLGVRLSLPPRPPTGTAGDRVKMGPTGPRQSIFFKCAGLHVRLVRGPGNTIAFAVLDPGTPLFDDTARS